jgi:hypothetical protein
LHFALEGKSRWLQWLNDTRAKKYYDADYEILAHRTGWVTSHFVDDSEIEEIIDELF